MNDSINSINLSGFNNNQGINLSNALAGLTEVGNMNYTKYPPADIFWTHRYNAAPGIYNYELYDQIWISPALKRKFVGAWVKRRKKVGGDGSDHDPVWIELNI